MKYGIESDHMVTLTEIARLLNDTFGFLGRARIPHRHPFIWWTRTLNDTITKPMPKPRMRLGKRESPVFNAIEVVQWYARWKQIPVRGGQAARRPTRR